MPVATDARYAITFVGGVTEKAEALTSLANDGPLCSAREHMVVSLAPDAFARDEASGGNILRSSVRGSERAAVEQQVPPASTPVTRTATRLDRTGACARVLCLLVRA